MDKETMIHILNQHGLDALHDVIIDAIDIREQHACEVGYDHGYETGYHEALTSWCAHDRYGFVHDED